MVDSTLLHVERHSRLKHVQVTEKPKAAKTKAKEPEKSEKAFRQCHVQSSIVVPSRVASSW